MNWYKDRDQLGIRGLLLLTTSVQARGIAPLRPMPTFSTFYTQGNKFSFQNHQLNIFLDSKSTVKSWESSHNKWKTTNKSNTNHEDKLKSRICLLFKFWFGGIYIFNSWTWEWLDLKFAPNLIFVMYELLWKKSLMIFQNSASLSKNFMNTVRRLTSSRESSS